MKSRVGRYVLPGLAMAILLGLALPGRAQTPSRTEQQLRRRVEQLYRLFVAGNWRAVEPFIAPDTMQLWLEQPKAKIDSFEIKEVQIAPGGKEADVTVMATFRIAQSDAPFTQGQKGKWVVQKGQWFLKVRRPPSLSELFKPNPNQLNNQADRLPPLVFDQNPVKIPRPKDGREVVVKIGFQNVTADPTTLRDLQTTCPCLKAEVEPREVHLAEKSTLTLTYNPSLHTNSERLAVRALAVPADYSLELPVELTD